MTCLTLNRFQKSDGRTWKQTFEQKTMMLYKRAHFSSALFLFWSHSIVFLLPGACIIKLIMAAMNGHRTVKSLVNVVQLWLRSYYRTTVILSYYGDYIMVIWLVRRNCHDYGVKKLYKRRNKAFNNGDILTVTISLYYGHMTVIRNNLFYNKGPGPWEE